MLCGNYIKSVSDEARVGPTTSLMSYNECSGFFFIVIQ